MSAGNQVGKGFSVSVAISNPTGTMTMTPSATGGTLAATTYWARWTWVTANGETAPTNSQSAATTGSTGSIVLQPPAFPSGVTAANIYVSTVSGQESYQGQISVSNGTFTLTSLSITGKFVPQYNLTAYQDINPSVLSLTVGSEFIVHNVYYNAPIAFCTWDGTTLVSYDGDTGAGARIGVAMHCNGSQWLRVYNTSATNSLQVSFDGMQTV